MKVAITLQVAVTRALSCETFLVTDLESLGLGYDEAEIMENIETRLLTDDVADASYYVNRDASLDGCEINRRHFTVRLLTPVEVAPLYKIFNHGAVDSFQYGLGPDIEDILGVNRVCEAVDVAEVQEEAIEAPTDILY